MKLDLMTLKEVEFQLHELGFVYVDDREITGEVTLKLVFEMIDEMKKGAI